jgi:hypothetical protein
MYMRMSSSTLPAQDAAKDVQSSLEYASLKSITSRVEVWWVVMAPLLSELCTQW